MSSLVNAAFGPSFDPSRLNFMEEPSRFYQKGKVIPITEAQAKAQSEEIHRLFVEAHGARREPTSLISKICEKLSIGIDANSFGRNVTSATTSIFKLGEGTVGTAVATGVNASSMAGASLGFFVGLNILRDRLFKIKEDVKNGNSEGIAEHSLDASMGASYSGVSAATIISSAAALGGAAGLAASAGFSSTILGLAMQAFIAIRSSYGIAVSALFREKIKDINLLTEFVKEGKTPEELNKKWDQFAFRTSEECGKQVRDYVIAQKNGADASTLQEKEKIILREVNRANKKQIMKHAFLISVAVISSIAFISALFLAGPFAPLLFAVGALLWLSLDSSALHEKIGNLLFKEAYWTLNREEPAAEVPTESAEAVSSSDSETGVSSTKLVSESEKEVSELSGAESSTQEVA